jgi:hypothetical protein
VNGNPQKPVVAFCFSVQRPLRLDEADNTDLDQATRMGRRVHQDKDVERIAVSA